MSGGLKVVAPGLHSTVQDFGRYGYQELGVPVSGALDLESLRLANVLVGNSRAVAGLEILYQGPALEVTAESVRIAVGGHNASIEVSGEEVLKVPAWESCVVHQGQIFRVLPGDQTSCCYLAIAGGFGLPPCLGSLSTYTRAGLGGFEGRALAASDTLPLVFASAPAGENLRLAKPPRFSSNDPVRIIWGPQQSHFTAKSLARFVAEAYSILPESDRMGFRLSGAHPRHVHGHDIVSDGIATGAIQVPGDGVPIILLADHQTTGGYPKIATVISADIPALGRRKPGDKIRFEAVDVEEAERAIRAREDALQKIEAAVISVTTSHAVDLQALYEENLISGVTGTD